MLDATRDEVQERWQQLINGVLTREQVHAWSAGWVVSQEELGDPVVEIGLLHLFGFDFSRPADNATDTTVVAQQHGGGPGRVYLSPIGEVAAQLEQWQRDARAFDEDSVKWLQRLGELHRRLMRSGRLEEAERVARLLAAPVEGAHWSAPTPPSGPTSLWSR